MNLLRSSACSTPEIDIRNKDRGRMAPPYSRETRIRSLSDCVAWIVRIAKALEKEFWLPFALRGAILEGIASLRRLADDGGLSRSKAIEIVGQLKSCCLFYKDLFGHSQTLNLVSELADEVAMQEKWSFSN